MRVERLELTVAQVREGRFEFDNGYYRPGGIDS